MQPFFARGALLQVDAALDLVEVAAALAEDDREKVAAWLAGGGLGKVEEAAAKDFLERDPPLWAVVVAPWVVIQERAEKETLH
ncbi:Uncharacterized conserved small protein [Streptococcus dysgalactiae subsp. equisimilis]|nr:Uncharacterized conserved small protein [Streptococcus dysgalactiae subsp. equisimilis]